MSVSTHLTPEPERRLWVIYDNIRFAAGLADIKIGALTIFAAGQMAVIKYLFPSAPLSLAAIFCLGVEIFIGILAFSPFSEISKRLEDTEPPAKKGRIEDLLTSAGDIAKYSRSELILRLDHYLGGGISATAYYEDITGLIVFNARIAVRKQRLFKSGCILAAMAQILLLAQIILDKFLH